jgi:glutamate decarboxylase
MELIAGTVGVGWIVWRGVDYLPKELIFELHYLGEVRFAYGYKV